MRRAMRWLAPCLLACACMLAALLSPAPEARAEEALGFMEGTVVDAAGAPVAGVTVDVWGATDGLYGIWDRRRVARCFEPGGAYARRGTSTTDATGRWRVDRLPTNTHLGVDAHARDGRRAPQIWRRAFVRRSPPSTLTLVATRAQTFRLIDHDGRGVAKASITVMAMSPRPNGGSSILAPAVETAADGSFRVHARPGASLGLTIKVPGVGQRDYLRTEMPGEPGPEPIVLSFREHTGRRVQGTVKDEDGKPVRGAHIVASSQTTGGRTPGAGGHLLAISDAEGKFKIEHLPGNQLTSLVIASHDHLLTRYPSDTQGWHVATPIDRDKPFEVDVQLMPGRSLSGTVLDEQGKPLGDAWVRGVIDDVRFGALRHARARTNAEGRFTLEHMPYRAFRIVVDSDTHVLPTPPASNDRRNREFQKRPGYIVSADAGDVVEGVTLRLVPGESLAGRVVDPRGAPVAAAAVQLRVQHDGGVQYRAEATDKEGRFAFHGLPFMQYPSVEVDAEGFAKQSPRWVRAQTGEAAPLLVTLQPGATVSGRITDEQGTPLAGIAVRRVVAAEIAVSDAKGHYHLTRIPPGRHKVILAGPGSTLSPYERVVDIVAGTDAEGVDFIVKNDAPLRGTEVIAGQVLDADGVPVSGVMVRIDHVSKPGASASTTSDLEGHFRFTELFRGKYRLHAGPPKRRPPIVESGTLDVRVEALSNDKHVLEGTVKDSYGRPIPTATIQIGYQGDGPTGSRMRVGLWNGRFRAAVPRSMHIINVSVLDPHDERGRPMNLLRKHLLGIRVDSGPIAISLDPAAKLAGRVLDETGAPVPGLILNVSRADRLDYPYYQPKPAETDREGRFMIPGLAAVPYKVVIKAPVGWTPPAVSTVAAPNEEVELRVTRQLGLAGRLLDHDGTPLRDVRAFAWAKAKEEGLAIPPHLRQLAGQMVVAHTDGEGRFVLHGLSDELVYTVNFNLPLHLQKTRFPPALERHPPGGKEVEIRLVLGSTVQGIIVDPKGNGLPNVNVMSLGPKGPDGTYPKSMSRTARTGEDGRFEIGPYPKGAKLTLRAIPWAVPGQPAQPWLPAALEKVSGRAKDVRIQLSRGVEVTGHIEGATAAELNGARISLVPEGEQRVPPVATYAFDGSGTKFKFVGLAPGRFQLQAMSYGRDRIEFPQGMLITAPSTKVVIKRVRWFVLTGRLTGVDAKGWRGQFFPDHAPVNPRRVRPTWRYGRTLADDGSFSFGRVRNESGVLYMVSRDRQRIVYLEFTPDGTPLAVKSKPARVIQGRISGLTDKIHSGKITATRGALQVEAKISEDGYFELEGLAPGPWQLSITSRSTAGTYTLPKAVKAGRKNVIVSWKALQQGK